MRILLSLIICLLSLPLQAIDLNGVAEFDRRRGTQHHRFRGAIHQHPGQRSATAHCRRQQLEAVQTLLPVELYSKTLLNKPAQVTYLKKSFRGKVVAINRQVSMGANNHPATYLQVKFSTDGLLPAGLPVKISVDAN